MKTASPLEISEFASLLDVDTDLETSWNSILDGFVTGTPGQRQELYHSVRSLHAEFIAALRLVSDPGEQDFLIASFYILLKSYWTVLNIRSNYLIAQGNVDFRNLCLSGLLSALLAKIEPYLIPSQVETITHFLSQPPSRTDPFPATPGYTISSESSFLTAEPGKLSPETRFSSEHDLVETIGRLQSRLDKLQEQQATLQLRLGKATMEEIGDLFQGLSTQLESASHKLHVQDTTLSRLCSCLNLDSADSLPIAVEQVLARSAETERALTEAQERDRQLEQLFGTRDIAAIADLYQKSRNNNELLSELEVALSSVERSMRYFNP